MIKKVVLSLTIILLICILDIVTKELVFNYFKSQGKVVVYILPFLNFVLVINKGISFGMLGGVSNILIILLNLFVLIILCYMMFISKNYLYKLISLSFIIGGGIGNIVDRLYCGYVRDFIDLHLWGYHWYSFNVADTFITIGGLCYILDKCFVRQK